MMSHSADTCSPVVMISLWPVTSTGGRIHSIGPATQPSYPAPPLDGSPAIVEPAACPAQPLEGTGPEAGAA
jgi:hypothetical protein